jgi:ABC-type lipopolysaccharide export system ATPase subunit
MQLLQRVKEQGITILLVEQSIHQALHISDRVYVLANGRIVFEGSAAALGQSDDLLRTYLGMDEEEKNATRLAPSTHPFDSPLTMRRHGHD